MLDDDGYPYHAKGATNQAPSTAIAGTNASVGVGGADGHRGAPWATDMQSAPHSIRRCIPHAGSGRRITQRAIARALWHPCRRSASPLHRRRCHKPPTRTAAVRVRRRSAGCVPPWVYGARERRRRPVHVHDARIPAGGLMGVAVLASAVVGIGSALAGVGCWGRLARVHAHVPTHVAVHAE
jgi:hypothetical protein